MPKNNSYKMQISFAALSLATLFAFQNCGNTNLSNFSVGKFASKSSGNGGGYEGMSADGEVAGQIINQYPGSPPPADTLTYVLFNVFGQCSGVDSIVSQIQQDPISHKYYLVRSNCQNVTPVEILPDSPPAGKDLIFDGQTYTRE